MLYQFHFLIDNLQLHFIIFLDHIHSLFEVVFNDSEGVASVMVGLYPLLNSLDRMPVILHLQCNISEYLLLLTDHANHPLFNL